MRGMLGFWDVKVRGKFKDYHMSGITDLGINRIENDVRIPAGLRGHEVISCETVTLGVSERLYLRTEFIWKGHHLALLPSILDGPILPLPGMCDSHHDL